MSEELPDPEVDILPSQPRGNSALRLPSSPSAAFETFDNPLTRPNPQRLNFQDFDFGFKNTDFRGPSGDFAKKSFNVKTKKTFGPHNLPTIRRKKLGFDF